MTWRSLFIKLDAFQKSALAAIVITFLLILIGGLVRASGAGLGCPDWPKCFGLWIPPTTVSDLPAGYDASDFNAIKTWTEYVNRLFGVLTGFFILLTAVFSIGWRKIDRTIPAGSFIVFVMVLFQGWLGGQVVQSGLVSWIITIHMIVALLILNMLVWVYFQSIKSRVKLFLASPVKQKLLAGLMLLLIITLIQIVLGTQVRESIELVKRSLPLLQRSDWLGEAGMMDHIHRSFSWLVLLVSAWLVWYSRHKHSHRVIITLTMVIFAGNIMQVSSGIGMVYLAIPPFLQVLHLWVSAFIITISFSAFLFVKVSGEK